MSIRLPMINVCPTLQCNLRCKLCGVLIPQYSHRPRMSMDEFRDSMRAVFEIVHEVGKLQITGGEPLLHSELPAMLEECLRRYDGRFDKLLLFTNCAARASDEVVRVLSARKDKVVVHCSDYGVKPEIAKELLGMLADAGIRFKHLKYHGEGQYFDGWVDQGDFIGHGRSEDDLRRIFSKCAHVERGGSWYVRNGQMHWCGRSIRGVELGKVPPRDGDCLDIFSGTIEERRMKLRALMQRRCIIACDYCNGCYGTHDTRERHPAGEQMP